MSVRSSEVLRLAAELEFDWKYDACILAHKRLKATTEDMKRQRKYLQLVNWLSTVPCTEHAVMALCLAAAIAEDEGD